MEKCIPYLSSHRLPHRLMRVDVTSFVGAYPFRRVPGTSPDGLLRSMDRVGIDQAWVSHLPSVFWRDPAAGNAWLYETARRHTRFLPVPAIHPGLAGWEKSVAEAASAEVPAVRCDPMYYGLDPIGTEMQALVSRCGQAQMPLL